LKFSSELIFTPSSFIGKMSKRDDHVFKAVPRGENKIEAQWAIFKLFA
jgi:hypothetical protein